jgi:hypothetical protein
VTTRRSFLAGLGALLAAPALVRASSLEYVPRALVLPEQLTLLRPPIISGTPVVGQTLVVPWRVWPEAPHFNAAWLRRIEGWSEADIAVYRATVPDRATILPASPDRGITAGSADATGASVRVAHRGHWGW